MTPSEASLEPRRSDTFAAHLEQAAGNETIESVVIGPFGWSDDMDDTDAYGEDRVERPVKPRRGVVLTWEEARPMLDYGYSSGFGAPECDAVWAWTPSRVLFVSQYDGATGVEWVPRNPVDGKPDMPGG